MAERKHLAAAAALALFAGCATTTRLEVPPALAPAASEMLAMVVPARGVQVYECRERAIGAGGVAPAEGCDRASIGRTLRVAYRADYHFYRGY